MTDTTGEENVLGQFLRGTPPFLVELVAQENKYYAHLENRHLKEGVLDQLDRKCGKRRYMGLDKQAGRKRRRFT